ncbi:hypothetical protein [Methylomonas sp. 11b]|uniref:hypothetical protein n=1 Tax=Methylomonas sp. 11b TaxID=1168169 RepID=UPI0012DFB241|nr:hypothetical protein [Methylomonas sp. 11b]
MKKPSSFEQQINQARNIVASWSPSHLSNMRLEGSDIFMNRQTNEKLNLKKHQITGQNK